MKTCAVLCIFALGQCVLPLYCATGEVGGLEYNINIDIILICHSFDIILTVIYYIILYSDYSAGWSSDTCNSHLILKNSSGFIVIVMIYLIPDTLL